MQQDQEQKIELNEAFHLAFRFATETGENIFLTGKAGTGKTTFLKYLRAHCSKNMLVAAPTGVAAINCGGVTLHSLFQLPLHCFIPTHPNKEALLAKARFNKQRIDLMRKVELLVIDEISMVRADTLDAIDTILRSVRRRHNEAFGGVQLLCIGDLYQLPPVIKNEDWLHLSPYYSSAFFFDSMVMQEQMPLMIELTTIYRQKEDAFVSLLNKVRNNIMAPEDIQFLHSRYQANFTPAENEKYITLTSHNFQADEINQSKLNRLASSSFEYKAEVKGNFPENLYPAEEELELREGAQVMFLKNDNVSKRFFNGKIGTVVQLSDDSIVVSCDGNEINVPKDTWENTRYSINHQDGKLEQEVLGTFEQFPLRMAWAITIHKSQGLTFDNVMIDAGAAFSSGQVYVALSRCTSLDGIILLNKIPPSAILCSHDVIRGTERLIFKGALAQRFEGARMVFIQQILEQLFSFTGIYKVFSTFLEKVKEHSMRLNPDGVDEILNLWLQFVKTKEVGERFIAHIYKMLKEEPVIENNKALQKRLSDAGNHFDTAFSNLIHELKNQHLITEHKEVSTEIDDTLNELVKENHTTQYAIQYFKNPFELTGYLQYMLELKLPRFNLSIYAGNKKSIPTHSDIHNPVLYEQLIQWRNSVVHNTGLPVYVVATGDMFKLFCQYLPLNLSDLGKIKGMGKVKMEKYANELLSLITDYCEQQGLESNMMAHKNKNGTSKPQKAPKENTKRISFSLFKEGLPIAEIAKQRGLVVQTIEGHLAAYVESGELSIDALVSPENIDRFMAVMVENPKAEFQQLRELLPGYGFGQLRLLMAHQNFLEKNVVE